MRSICKAFIALVLIACGQDGQSTQCEVQYDSSSYDLNQAIYRYAQPAGAQVELYLWTTTRACEDESLVIARDFKMTFPDQTERCFTGIYTVILSNGPHSFTVESALCPQ